MASLSDTRVRELLEGPLHATLSTVNEDGSIHSAVGWISLEDGVLAVNSAEGRRWPANLDRNPEISVLVYPPDNPYEYVAVRGTAARDESGDTDDHINRLAKLYIDQDEYPFRAPGEVRIKYVITPNQVRYQKQG